jgi:hypothetical protein
MPSGRLFPSSPSSNKNRSQASMEPQLARTGLLARMGHLNSLIISTEKGHFAKLGSARLLAFHRHARIAQWVSQLSNERLDMIRDGCAIEQFIRVEVRIVISKRFPSVL